MKIACLAVMLAGVCSCSVDDADQEMFENNKTGIDHAVSAVLQQFKGKYTGVWWMNDVKVKADTTMSLINEKYADYHSDVDSYPSFVRFNYDLLTSSSSLDCYEFPFKAIVRQMFPNIEIAYLTIDTQIGAPFDTEEKLYSKIFIEAGDSGDKNICPFYSIPLEIVGYSEKAVYFNLRSAVGSAYLRMPYVVTTKDGNYFAMVLDFVPTVSMGIASETMSCNFIIQQIEIYDKDMQKSILSLDQDIKLTFISTEKKSE